MTVYELMAFLAKQPAGDDVVVSVAESDNREIIGMDDAAGVELQILWPEEDDDG